MTDRNIVDLAHAVLDAAVPDVPWKIQLQEFQARAAAAPTLARAVIDLTATIKRVEALADDMDHDADLLDQTDDLRLHLIAATHREDATRLRTALNGDDK